MAEEMKPAYLIAGSDEARIETARARLRARAQREGGGGALEVLERRDERRGPDPDAVAAALNTLSLAVEQRYVLVEGVELWGKREARAVADAVVAVPPGTTLVLVARLARAKRERSRQDEAMKPLMESVEQAGGQLLSFEAPSERELPRRLVADARGRGYELEPDAARLLVDRLGPGQVRLSNELDRLAVWAGGERRVGVADVESMVADTSEQVAWELADAVVERDPARAVSVAERLTVQGSAPGRLVWQLARRLRDAATAADALAAGRAAGEVERSLRMHPYAARKLVARVREAEPGDLRAALAAVADLEAWTRGETDYDESVALTLAVRRAAGG